MILWKGHKYVMNKKRLLSNLMLLLTAFIWGSSFVAQSMGSDHLGALSFCGIRYPISVIAMIPVVMVTQAAKRKRLLAQAADGAHVPTAGISPFDLRTFDGAEESHRKQQRKDLLLGGLFCGTFMFVGTVTQQMGLAFTSAGKAGFLTALYVVLVPIFALLAFRQKPGLLGWAGVLLGVAGLYFLCVTGTFTIEGGDLVILLGSLFWAGHILAAEFFMKKGCDGVRLSQLQFAVCGLFSIIAMFLFEEPSLTDIWASIIPLLYTAILSSVVGFTLQLLGQKNTNPTVASLILSLESVFAAVCGAIVLQETMSAREIGGAALLFAGIILSQLPAPTKKQA